MRQRDTQTEKTGARGTQSLMRVRRRESSTKICRERDNIAPWAAHCAPKTGKRHRELSRPCNGVSVGAIDKRETQTDMGRERHCFTVGRSVDCLFV